MSHNRQQVELTDITVPLLEATQGFTMEDRDASPSIGILLDCAKRGRNHRKQRPPSICKVPRILRDLSVRSFVPQLVSIGPIHRENKKLQEFEWQKECYLDDLLSRCDSTPEGTLEAFLRKVNTLIPKIRESYAGVIENYSDDKLVTMMVMDGCFILEFCFKHEDEENVYLTNKMQTTRIAMDLMLLENQVPLFVLQALFDCSMGKMPFTLSDVLNKYLAPYIKLFYPLPEKNSILSNVLNKYLAPYIKLFRSLLPEKILDKYLAPCLELFCSVLPEKNPTTDVDSDSPEEISTTDVDSDSTHDHVLGYLHKRYKLVAANSKLVDEETAKSWNPVDAEALRSHTIVELDRSGMNFKPHQEDEWSMTIKFQAFLFPCLPWFWSKPTLLMPTMVIDEFTELILRNFIAYEQSFPHVCYYFTSYVHAMDMLIDTQEDIAKLVESEVLVNMLVSNQVAAGMINKICKNMFVTDFYYTREFKQMDNYYNSDWPMIKRTYFSNPWNTINLLGGIIVSLATVVGGIFAVMQYFG